MTEHDTNQIQLPGDTEDPGGGMTWLLGLASTFLLISVLIATNAMFYHVAAYATTDKEIGAYSVAAELMREERKTQLEQEPHWEAWTDIDGELTGERTLHVPMDTAADIVVKRWGGASK